MNTVVIPIKEKSPITIREYNKDFISIEQKNGDGWDENPWDIVIVHKENWNEFVHNLTLFEINK